MQQYPNQVIYPTGITPAGLTVDDKNHRHYVCNNNNYSLTGSDSVSVMDLKKEVVKTIINDSSFNQPYTATLNKKLNKIYITNSNSTTVSIVDPRTNTVVGTIAGFDGPSGFAVSEKRQIGYVNNYGGPILGSGNGHTVSVVDLRANTILTTIGVAVAPAAISISRDYKYVYVISYVDGTVGTGVLSKISTETNTVISTISGFFGPFDIALTSCGKKALISNFGNNDFTIFGTTVSLVDLRSMSIITNINTYGIQPSGIVISPNNKYGYISLYNSLYAGADFTDLTQGQGLVLIIDLCKNKIIGPSISVGQSPGNITISRCGKFLYVSCFTSNIINQIDISKLYNCNK